VRYAAAAGDLRNLHATSLGKALLSELDEAERRELLERAGMPRRTPRSIGTPAAFERELRASRERGWFMSLGDGVPDVGAIALPVRVLNETYAMSIAGPLSRIEPAIAAHVRALRAACHKVEIRAGH
jgi:DNA-binding IclR family transcriptional regulator